MSSVKELLKKLKERCSGGGDCTEGVVETISEAAIADLRYAVFVAREYGVNVELAVFNSLITQAEILLFILRTVGGPYCEVAELYVKIMDRVFHWMEDEGLLTGPRWPFLAWVYPIEEKLGCRYISDGDREALKKLFEERHAVVEYLTIKLLMQVVKLNGAVAVSYDFVVKRR
ncbi:MAG: hypothetical protein ACPL3C_01250 [Pyrobaculum sp.]|jgi:hypothetical protein|uniref:hypothetical protein n=1 Tax=Pyrobaculum sp. TaxID=2004705 RepID=UPI003C8892BB